MFIGDLSKLVGIPTQTIRYYEKLGLIDSPKRTDTQYRIYSKEDQARLRFIMQAKNFGLSLEEIKEMINLRTEGIAPCEHLKEVVKRHLDDVNRRIQEMSAFRDELAHRYEKLNKPDPNFPDGTICGLIERECRCASQRETLTDGGYHK